MRPWPHIFCLHAIFYVFRAIKSIFSIDFYFFRLKSCHVKLYLFLLTTVCLMPIMKNDWQLHMCFGSFLQHAEIQLSMGMRWKPAAALSTVKMTNAAYTTVQIFGWEGRCEEDSEPGDQPIHKECTFFGGEKPFSLMDLYILDFMYPPAFRRVSLHFRVHIQNTCVCERSR